MIVPSSIQILVYIYTFKKTTLAKVVLKPSFKLFKHFWYKFNFLYFIFKKKQLLIEAKRIWFLSSIDVQNNFTYGLTSLCPFKEVSYIHSWNLFSKRSSRVKPAAIYLSPKTSHSAAHQNITTLNTNNIWSSWTHSCSMHSLTDSLFSCKAKNQVVSEFFRLKKIYTRCTY